MIVSVGNNFFYTKSLPCSLWFFDKGKSKALRDKVLFIDARNYYTVVASLALLTEGRPKGRRPALWADSELTLSTLKGGFAIT